MESSQQPNRAVVSLIVIVLIAIAAGGIYAAKNAQASNAAAIASSTSMTNPTTATTTTSASSSPTSTTAYKDGTYTVTSTYFTPGGSEDITVTLTLANGTISSTSADGSAMFGDSARYQSRFLSSYQSSVVGKPLDSLSLSRVAGSSLTTEGFNSAVDKIRSQAAV